MTEKGLTTQVDHVLIVGSRHLEYMRGEFVRHYEQARPHQGLGQRIPRHTEPIRASENGVVLRHDRLGGLLHEYMRQAA